MRIECVSIASCSLLDDEMNLDLQVNVLSLTSLCDICSVGLAADEGLHTCYVN